METTKYLSPRAYEMMAILLPDQGDEETSAAIEKMLGYITDEQGTVDSVSADSPWGRRRLAYTIRHEGVDYRDGHYVLVYFTAMPSAISEIEREMKLDTNVIRYLLLTHDPHMGEQIDTTAAEASDEDEDAAADEAPAEDATTDEAPAETAEATEEEAPVAETATEEAPVADEAPVEAEEETVASDEAATEETGTEESAEGGEVEESAEA